jgi:hypothetical protein
VPHFRDKRAFSLVNGDEIILAQENVYLVGEIRDGFSISPEGDPVPDGKVQVALIIVGFGALVLLLGVFDGERVEAEGLYQPAPVLLVGSITSTHAILRGSVPSFRRALRSLRATSQSTSSPWQTSTLIMR